MNTADRGGVCDLVLVSRTRSAEEKFCSAGPADASIERRTFGRATLVSGNPRLSCRGTKSSNPPPSSEESANFRSLSIARSADSGPSRHPLVFGRLPGVAGYTAHLAPAISRRDEEGFSVAQHVLVTVPSLPPRRGEQPYRSAFGCSCCLRPSEVGSALRATFSRPQCVLF